MAIPETRSIDLAGDAQPSKNGIPTLGKQGTALKKVEVSTITTAAAVTYTAAQIAGGLILRDPNGGARTDVTPTAQALVQLLGLKKGAGFVFAIRNTAGAAQTITVSAGTGVTLSGTMTIAQNNSKSFLVVCTEDRVGAEALTVYSLGTVVH
jgi:hypothetical protein